MITLIYTEVKTEEIYEEELYDALIDVWEDNGNDISNINELRTCWHMYENDIVNNIYSIWVDGEIKDTNLNIILTPKFWEGFYKYVKKHE